MNEPAPPTNEVQSAASQPLLTPAEQQMLLALARAELRSYFGLAAAGGDRSEEPPSREGARHGAAATRVKSASSKVRPGPEDDLDAAGSLPPPGGNLPAAADLPTPLMTASTPFPSEKS